MKKQLFPQNEMSLFIDFVNSHEIDLGSYADEYVKYRNKQKTLNSYKTL